LKSLKGDLNIKSLLKTGRANILNTDKKKAYGQLRREETLRLMMREKYLNWWHSFWDKIR